VVVNRQISNDTSPSIYQTNLQRQSEVLDDRRATRKELADAARLAAVSRTVEAR